LQFCLLCIVGEFMRRERGLNRRFYQSLFLYARRGEKKREKEEDLVMGGACPECEKKRRRDIFAIHQNSKEQLMGEDELVRGQVFT
jgi:hypothetical protein